MPGRVTGMTLSFFDGTEDRAEEDPSLLSLSTGAKRKLIIYFSGWVRKYTFTRACR